MTVLLADTGYQRVVAGEGFVIAMTGMLVVFASLILISVAISLLAKLFNAISDYQPDLENHTAGASNLAASAQSKSPQPTAAAAGAPSERLVAAIGFALHARNSQ